MRLFRSEEHVRQWSATSGIPVGAVFSLDALWRLAQPWFHNRLSSTWRRATMAEPIKENAGEDMHPSMPVEAMRVIADKHGVAHNPSWGSGKIIEELFEASAESALIQPTFVTGHPVEKIEMVLQNYE